MVTAEIAVALPALMVLLAIAVSAVTVVGAQLRCIDAAREAARAAARGDPQARRYAAAVAPAGASVAVTTESEQVTATVRASVHPLSTVLPGFGVSGSAVARHEPGAP